MHKYNTSPFFATLADLAEHCQKKMQAEHETRNTPSFCLWTTTMTFSIVDNDGDITHAGVIVNDTGEHAFVNTDRGKL